VAVCSDVEQTHVRPTGSYVWAGLGLGPGWPIIGAIVVIVGRPNTGKSTLFNRLVGGRVAITLQQPGITRDRIVRQVRWREHTFKVCDTGGLVPDSAEEMAREVERQVQIALSGAQVTVLVTDGAAGLAPLDEEVAERLRRAGRKFLVAANKLDRRRTFDAGEFHKLGAELVIPISAETGTGVDDLLDAIVARLGSRKDDSKRGASGGAARPCPSLVLAILGRPNVGKSSLLNTLLGRERAIVTATPGTTRDVVEDEFELEGRRFRLLDTAGIRRKPKVKEAVAYYSVTRAIDQIEHCDVAIVMFDAFDGPTNQDKRVVNLVEERDKGMVIVANKMDLVPEEKKQPVRDWVKKELAFAAHVPVVFASVARGEGVKEVVRRAGRVWDSGATVLPRALLRRDVLPRLESHPPRPDVRVLGLSQVGVRPPRFFLRLSRPCSLDPPWERFVVSLIRRRARFPGYPIRLTTAR
jgi:GTP-binding protein